MRVFLLIGFLLFFTASARADMAVVAEVFLSSSCAADPAKDAEISLLLERYPDVLFLSCHGTFLDERYKKETGDYLDVCERRKFNYSTAHDLGALSKQLVMVNGRYDANRLYPNIVESALVMADALDSLRPIKLQRSAKGLQIKLPALKLQDQTDLDVLLYIYAPEIAQDEISGMQITNPVYLIESLAPWDGRARTLEHALPDGVAGLAAVILAQDRNFGALRAAGHLQNL